MTVVYKRKLEYEFRSDFGALYQHVLDLKKFGNIHPYMTEVIILDQAPDYIEYAIKEELYLLGFIKMKPRYNARVFEVEKGKHIRYVSQVDKNVLLEINFTFTNENNLVNFVETIEVSGNKWIVKFFISLLEKTHRKLFEKLRALLDEK